MIYAIAASINTVSRGRRPPKFFRRRIASSRNSLSRSRLRIDQPAGQATGATVVRTVSCPPGKFEGVDQAQTTGCRDGLAVELGVLAAQWGQTGIRISGPRLSIGSGVLAANP